MRVRFKLKVFSRGKGLRKKTEFSFNLFFVDDITHCKHYKKGLKKTEVKD